MQRGGKRRDHCRRECKGRKAKGAVEKGNRRRERGKERMK